MNKKIELLSPAGDFNTMKACYNAGADAVYMGLPRFSARAYAVNSKEEEYLQAIDYAHFHGKKLYCTVNILMKEEEISREFDSLITPLYERGLDAVIVQDLGLIRYIKENYPDLPVFASTQTTSVSSYSVQALKDLGAERIILARELSLKEIRKIKDETGAELETFIHGALCYSYSGQCLFSSLAGGRSGNRGRCAQPCRMNYQVSDENQKILKKDVQILSLKDLNSLEILPEIIEAGVTSLKIEGRMKKAEYAAGVTSIYRKYLDLFDAYGKDGYKVDPMDEKNLYDLFNRQGFTEGYFKQHNARDMVTMKANDFREENKGLNNTIREKYILQDKKTEIRGEYRFSLGMPYELKIEAEIGGKNYSLTHFSEEPAVLSESRSAVKEEVEKQLKKTGNTFFTFTYLQGSLDQNLFLPVKQINDFRRQAIQNLENTIRDNYKRTVPEKKDVKHLTEDILQKEEFFLSSSVMTENQLEAVLNHSDIKRIYLYPFSIESGKLNEIQTRLKKEKRELYLSFPRIFRQEAEKRVKEWLKDVPDHFFDGYLVPSLDVLYFLNENGFQGKQIADYSLYAYNTKALSAIRDLGIDEFTSPEELSCNELRKSGLVLSGKMIYGRIPMMVSAGCIRKNTKECLKRKGIMYLTDRMKNRMPVINDCVFCMNIILNSKPLSLLTDSKEVNSLGVKEGRLDFTVESYRETDSILKQFESVYLSGTDPEENIPEFTHGHFYRGVE